MGSLNISRFTKVSTVRLLDIAYIVVLAPLLFVIKLPMLLFMLFVVILLVFQKEPTALTLVTTLLLGVLALFLAQYGTFNVSGLSRLKVFLEFLVYMLVIAISLQRLTRTVNFYLTVSPMLLLALSLFFFHSIAMLLYVIFEVFVLIWVILANRMYAHAPAGTLSLGEYGAATLRMSTIMFLYSLPWVIVLFMIFPRISFEHASYGFRGETERRTGHDGTMHLDNKALLVPSERVVMEVGFDRPLTPDIPLYFRGSVLYNAHETEWTPIQSRFPRLGRAGYESIAKDINYKIKLYPTQKQWLYLLDMPIDLPTDRTLKVTIDSDYITTVKKPIKEPINYQGHSALIYELKPKIDTETLLAASSYKRFANPKSQALAKRIREQNHTNKERVQAIIDTFRESNLTYTLKPAPLDLNNSVDSFLFEHRRGYCVHYASAFALMARMADIPSRIVTGYRGDVGNSINDYLIVKERDAHAWVELYIDGRWVRYEPTSTAAFMDDNTTQNTGANTQQDVGSFGQIDLYLMYIKYQIDTWILNYSHFRQMKLLEDLRNNPALVLKLVAAFFVLVVGSLALTAYINRPKCSDEVLCIMEPLLKQLAKEGYIRPNSQTMHRFLMEYYELCHSETIAQIAGLYEKLRYARERSPAELKELRAFVKLFLRGK